MDQAFSLKAHSVPSPNQAALRRTAVAVRNGLGVWHWAFDSRLEIWHWGFDSRLEVWHWGFDIGEEQHGFVRS